MDLENVEAWEIYQALCGRTVRNGHLDSWLLERKTCGWPIERVEALLERLDIISGVLEPDGRSEDQHRR